MSAHKVNNFQNDAEMTETEDKAIVIDGNFGRIKRWAFKPDHETSLVSIFRCFVRILFIMFHEFNETAIMLRASALTYSIVLSMIPILAMSTAVLKGLGSDNQLKVAAYRLIDQLEPEKKQQNTSADPQNSEIPSIPENEITTYSQATEEILPQNDPDEVKESSPAAGAEQSMTSHLRSAVDTIFEYVDRTNFAAIGAFGIVGLLISVVLVLSTIESAMNEIWHTKKGRSVFRKIMDYLALLILLPISINVALAGDAILQSPKILSYIHTIIPSAWAVKMLLKFLPFLFVILTLMVMYQFFPNVSVKTHAAFAGALFAGFFWFVVQRVYIVLQIGVANYNAIYGSFATVPLFLIWIYLGWTFILLGATLAYAVQNRHMYHLPGAGSSPQRELQLAFDVLNTIYTNFAQKLPTSLDDLSRSNTGDLPGDIQDIVNRLVDGGLLYRTENHDQQYVPVAPSENIEAKEVVQLILGHEDLTTPGGEFSRQVVKAAEKAIPGDAFPVIEQTLPESTASIEKDNNEKAL